MQIDVNNARFALFLINHVIIPNFLIHRFFAAHFFHPTQGIEPGTKRNAGGFTTNLTSALYVEFNIARSR